MPKPKKKQYRQMHPSKDKKPTPVVQTKQTGNRAKFDPGQFGQNLWRKEPDRRKAYAAAVKFCTTQLGLNGKHLDTMVTSIMRAHDSVRKGHKGSGRV